MSTPITLTGAYTCTHHNDKQRTECPVCLVATLRARADRAEADLAALEQSFDDNCRGVVKIADDLAAERARLDWVFHNCKVTSDDFTVHDREDLGAAMKEDVK